MKEKVIFICTGNTCRSPLAEKIFNHIAAERGIDADATSYGLQADVGQPMHKNSQQALRNMGYSEEELGHSSQQLTDRAVASADYIFTMTDSQAAMVGGNAECLADYNGGKDIFDPYNMNQETYEETARQITAAIEKIIQSKFKGEGAK